MEKEKKFEDMLEELENIVQSLEQEDLKLDESISKFEAGMKLAKDCNKRLEEAEKKITVLINEDGEVTEEDFMAD